MAFNIPFVVTSSLAGYFAKTTAVVSVQFLLMFYIFDFLYNLTISIFIIFSDSLYALSPQVYSILLYFGFITAFNTYISFVISSYFLNIILNKFFFNK